jgi:hypothetical protein
VLSKALREKIKSDTKLRVVILLLSSILIAAMFPRGESIESDVPIGSIWIQDDLIASMPFEILKDPETYRIEKLRAADNVPEVFELNRDLKNEVIDSIVSFNNRLIEILDEQLRTNEFNNRATFLSESSFEKLRNIRKYENSLSVSFSNSLQKIFAIIISLTNDIYSNNFLNVNYSDIKKDTIALRDGKFENLVPISRFYDNDSNE